MPTRLHFEGNLFGAATVAEVAIGERVMDACDAVEAAVPFSCRDANCGTCLLEVTRGAELLDAPKAQERMVLLALGRLDAHAPAARYRLGCQAVVIAAGEVTLRLGRPAADD